MRKGNMSFSKTPVKRFNETPGRPARESATTVVSPRSLKSQDAGKATNSTSDTASTLPNSSTNDTYTSSYTSESGSGMGITSKQLDHEKPKTNYKITNKKQSSGNCIEELKLTKGNNKIQKCVNSVEELNSNSKSSTKKLPTTEPSKVARAPSPREPNTRIPRPAAPRQPQKATPNSNSTDPNNNLQQNKLQKTGQSQCSLNQVKDVESTNVTMRTCETDGETRSEPELVVLKPTAAPQPRGLSVGAGEDPSTLSPASSARLLPHGEQTKQMDALIDHIDVGDIDDTAPEDTLQTSKEVNANFNTDIIKRLSSIGIEYHDICSTTAFMVLDVIKKISGNVEDWEYNSDVVNFLQKDAKIIESRMNENKKDFDSVITSLKSSLFGQVKANDDEVRITEEKVKLEKANTHLQNTIDSMDKKLQDYKMKYDEVSKLLTAEREQVKILQTEKHCAELEVKTNCLAEQQKCEKLERKIEKMEMDIKIKDELYDKTLTEYHNKVNVSAELNDKLKKEKTQLESRLEEITSEKAKISAHVKELASQVASEKVKLQKEENWRKDIMIELDDLKKKELKYKETIQELEETIRLKKENENHSSAMVIMLKEEKCSYERKVLSQQQRIHELEKEKVDTLAECEAVSNKLLAEKESMIRKLTEEVKTCRKEVSSSKEYCTQLEQKLKNMVDTQAQDTTKQQLEALSRERHSMDAALKEAYEYNGRVEQELEDMKQEVEKMDRLIHEKDSLLKVRNDLIMLLQNNESVHQKEIDKASREIDTYRRHFQKMQAELRVKEGQLKALHHELNRMGCVMQKAKTEFEVLEKNHNDQRARLEARIAELESAQIPCNNKPETLPYVGLHDAKYAHNTKLKHRAQSNMDTDIVCIPQTSNTFPVKHSSKPNSNYHYTPLTLITHADTIVIDKVHYANSKSKTDTANHCDYTNVSHCFANFRKEPSKISSDFVTTHTQHRASAHHSFSKEKEKKIHIIQTEIVESETCSDKVSRKNHSSKEIWLVTNAQKQGALGKKSSRKVSDKSGAKLIIPVTLVPQQKTSRQNAHYYSYFSQFIDIGSTLSRKQ